MAAAARVEKAARGQAPEALALAEGLAATTGALLAELAPRV
jgi:hypothetical protein